MTPFDVVRIRLQAQKKPLSKGMCFMYCNGLMDHVCACVNGQVAEAQWYRKGGHFTGVQVRGTFHRGADKGAFHRGAGKGAFHGCR